jgi:glycosyltransferase involved in cell wall biosynthesis
MPTLLSVNNYHYYRGGAETVFLEHNRLFEALGWQVAPFAMHHPKNLPTPWSEYFVEEIEFGGEYSLGEKLKRLPKVVYSFEARQKLARLLSRISPDVCHAHNLYHHISPSILGLLHERGIPVVLTLHDLKIACPAYQMLTHDGICERCRGGRLYNVALHRCIKGSVALSAIVMAESVVHRLLGTYRRHVTRFVVPSRFYLEKLVEWGFPRESFTHIPNFVDPQRFQPNYMAGDAFVYFGRISPEKGIGTLIRAAAQARARVLIIGTGPDVEPMRKLASDLNADVDFLGYMTGSALHSAVAAARAIVLPSEWYENAPMSVLEAYASGKPVIGARIGGIPELIQDRQTGITFESGNAAALAAALRELMTASATQIAQMGRDGRSWIEREFTLQHYRERMLDLYQTIAGPRLA